VGLVVRKAVVMSEVDKVAGKVVEEMEGVKEEEMVVEEMEEEMEDVMAVEVMVELKVVVEEAKSIRIDVRIHHAFQFV
jgi:hypothetical protein